MKKTIFIVLVSILVLLFVIAGLGIYKFNYLQDDIFYQGSAIGPSDEKLFYGSWVEPDSGKEKEIIGFTLDEGGTATSINMPTYEYKSWWLEPGRLVLVAENIGSRQSFIDTTAYDIESLGSYRLELKKKGTKVIFKRR